MENVPKNRQMIEIKWVKFLRASKKGLKSDQNQPFFGQKRPLLRGFYPKSRILGRNEDRRIFSPNACRNGQSLPQNR
jgi:hypothetical protein